MLAEVMLMAATVWYVPGWMRAQCPQTGVLPAVTNAFPGANVVFKDWDGDRKLWPLAVESADKESWRLAFELATMTEKERAGLTIVGHSLGGRIVARVLARLGEKGLHVRQAVLMAAAIPDEDPDLALMGVGSELPVVAICNPDDVTLRYVYALVGGEKGAAFGANGTLRPISNVVERVTPPDITKRVDIDRSWAKNKTLKDLANHHSLFYLDYLKSLREGTTAKGDVMVPQSWPTIEHRVMDAGIWWDVVDEVNGWKLERHKLTHHLRIISDSCTCVAWGDEESMRKSFRKVRSQVTK